MSEITQFNFPTTIRFGRDVIKELGPHLKAKNFKSPLLVTDPICAELIFFKGIKRDLENQGLRVLVFDQIAKNPVKSNVHTGSNFFHSGLCDCIVGIGGGASIDVARAIALKANHPEDLFQYEDGTPGEQDIINPIPYFVTVPTTSGTGSEVGRSSIISDDITHQKKILFSPNLLAKMVFADPMLTMDLPPFITAATGMDALTHNVEALVAKMFHPMCEGIALEGIKLIEKSITRAVKNPDYDSRANMLLASLMGAVAFQKGLGVVHSMAHPMSTMFDCHHGLANAICLPYGVKFNSEVAAKKLVEVERIFRSDHLFNTFMELNTALGLPTRLSSQGIKGENLAALSELAAQDFCHPNNPRPCTQKDFFDLYNEAL